MKRTQITFMFALILLYPAASLHSQQTAEAMRNRTREQLRTLLDKVGTRSDVNVSFRQSEQQPYNFVGVMKEGLTNSDSLEIVISVTSNDTIGVRIYPHYKGAYINADTAKNGVGLMRKLLHYSDQNFLFWGIDSSSDVFSGYTFTLESGFPEEAVTIVMRSIRNTDKFVGEMKPLIDGTNGQ